MRKYLRAAAATLALLLIVATQAIGISDMGNPAITRIFRSDDAGDRFACTASYIMPRVKDAEGNAVDRASWILSAGHCKEAELAKRNSDVNVYGGINWRMVLESHNDLLTDDVDLALGTVPDMRQAKSYLWLAEKAEPGRVYIHGFPQGVEQVSIGYIVPFEAVKDFTFFGPGLYGEPKQYKISDVSSTTGYLIAPKGSILPGSSGSPVLNQDGRVVGVVWGILPPDLKIEGLKDEYMMVFFTPVEKLIKMMDLLGVKR